MSVPSQCVNSPFPFLQLLTTEIVKEVVIEEFPHAHINEKNVRVVVTIVCYVCSLVYVTPVWKLIMSSLCCFTTSLFNGKSGCTLLEFGFGVSVTSLRSDWLTKLTALIQGSQSGAISEPRFNPTFPLIWRDVTSFSLAGLSDHVITGEPIRSHGALYNNKNYFAYFPFSVPICFRDVWRSLIIPSIFCLFLVLQQHFQRYCFNYYCFNV